MIWALFVFAAAEDGPSTASSTNATEVKLAGYGSSRFVVNLKGCRTSQGIFNPSFNGFNVGPYELEVDPTVEVVTINPILDLRQYLPRSTPEITLDDKVVEYSPINTIDVVVNFTGRLRGYDKTLELTIADPQASFLTGNSITYYIHLKKMANPAITSLKSLKLLDVANKEIQPQTTNHANKYTFVVHNNMKELLLDFKCQDESTESRVNGHYFDTGYPYPITMSDCETTLLLTCCYNDEEFTPNGETTRTYMVMIERNALLANTKVELHTTPDNGHCRRTDKVRWSCVSNSEDFKLIASWNKSDATMAIVNDKHIRTRMIRNIPTVVYIESGTHDYKMVLTAGIHNRTYHVSITQKGASNVVVLPDIPVLLNLWWGQGSCKKHAKAFSCIAKQDQINIVVHFAHSDEISAQLQTPSGKVVQDIHMGLPGGLITIRPNELGHYLLKMWTKKDKIEYSITVTPHVRHSRKHHKVARTGPQTVAEENKANAEKAAREKTHKKGLAVRDFLATHLFYT